MEEMGLGPNGGLVYCFEFLLDNLDFLTDALDPLSEEYLIIIDMPGQIELYTHIPILPALVQHLTRTGSLDVRLCAAYLLEATFVIDRAKFFAGTLSAMSAMIMLEIPHINILSKMDLVKGQVGKRELTLPVVVRLNARALNRPRGLIGRVCTRGDSCPGKLQLRRQRMQHAERDHLIGAALEAGAHHSSDLVAADLQGGMGKQKRAAGSQHGSQVPLHRSLHQDMCAFRSTTLLMLQGPGQKIGHIELS